MATICHPITDRAADEEPGADSVAKTIASMVLDEVNDLIEDLRPPKAQPR
jgi:hypothetical protein